MKQNGSVVKRDGPRGTTYSAVYADPKVRDKRGRKKVHWRAFPTKEAAEKYLDVKLGSIRTGVHIPPSQKTWKELMIGPPGTKSSEPNAPGFEANLDRLVRINHLSPSTAQSYKSLLRKHLVPFWGEERAQDMEPEKCREWARSLTAVDEATGEMVLSPKSITNIINLMSKVCDWAKLNAFITTNWVKDAELERPITPPKSLDEEAAMFLDEVEIEAIKKLWRDPAASTTAKTLAALGLLAGLRRGEIAAFPWGAIDWDGKRIRVVQAVSAGKLRTTAKSDASRAHVDVPEQLLTILREHLVAERAAGRPTKGGAFVLQNPRGKLAGQMYHPDELSEFWETAVRAPLKLAPTSTPHALRHTFASILISKLKGTGGNSIKYASAQLRHANIQITVDTYGHIFPSEGREHMAALDAFFAPTGTSPEGGDSKVLPFAARA